MAIHDADYLKERFADLKTPIGSEFSDLIDSCINYTVSGVVGFYSLSAVNVSALSSFSILSGGNSYEWDSSYTTVKANSALWGMGGSSMDIGVRSLTANWENTYNTVQSNSAYWATGGSSTDTEVRSLTSNWQNTFTTVQSNSSTWNYQGSDIKALTAGWVGGNVAYTNLVANSAAYLSASNVDLSFLSVSGNWNSVYSTVNSNSATTWNYQGTDLKNLSANWVGGNAAYTNLVANSAAYLSAVDLSFLSISGNWNSTYTTVQDNSASWAIDSTMDTAVRELTANWESTYTTVQSNSSNWDYQGSDVKALTAGWVGGNDAYTNLVANSAAYLSAVDLSFLSVSSNWDSTYTTVNTNSATTWNYQGSDIKALTAGWDGGNDAYTNLVSNSAAYLSAVDLSFLSVSSNWDSTYTTVNSNSSTWDYQGSDVKALTAGWVGGNDAYTNLVSNSAAYLSAVDLSFLSVSANWDSTYTTVNSNSSKWDYQGNDLKALSAEWVGGFSSYTTVQENSSNWDSTYSTVNANSATNWNYQGTDLKDLSGNWQNTFTEVQSYSSNWNSSYNYVNTTSANLVLTDDARLSDSRTPTGTAGGDLDGTYPNPTIKDSVALYGQPTAPTAAAGTNTSQIATTEFVQNNRGDKYLTTSNSSNTIDNGSNKTFVVASSSLAYTPTQDVTIVLNGDPLNNHMHCTVVSYSGYNLVVDVSNHTGSGTHSDWTINVGGLTTQLGVLLQANNLSDVSNAATALTNLGGVSATRQIITGTGLTGGGDLTTDRTISIVFGNTSSTAVSGDDERLSDSRNPLAHKTTHAIGGTDYLSPSDIGAVSNLTLQNLSGNWESTYSTVNANSATTWNYQGTDLKNLSSTWVGGNIAYTNLISNSAAYLSAVDLSFLSVSGNWNSVYSTVNANSATTWNYQGTDLKNLSSGWVGGNTAYTNLVSNSAAYLSAVDLSFLSVSGNWNSTYNTVQSNSATTWNYQGTDLKNLSSGWVGGNDAYTNLISNSAAYLSAVDLSFLSVSGNWNSVYSTVNANSAITWNYQGTDLKNLSAGWVGGNSAYTTVQANSSAWMSLIIYSKKFDYVANGIDYSYSGIAPQNTLDSDPLWKITRLAFNDTGSLSSTGIANNVTWNERLTATYI